jgi:hypothetical protein
MSTAACRYCGAELQDASKTSCDWCNQIIQEANCHGIYLADAANAVSKRDDLVSPEARRAEIQATFDRYRGG